MTVVGTIVWLFFLVVFAVGIALAIRRQRERNQPTDKEPDLLTLKRRFDMGSISREEYEHEIQSRFLADVEREKKAG